MNRIFSIHFGRPGGLLLSSLVPKVSRHLNQLGKGSALDIRFSRRLKPQCNENKILVTLRITV